jgi:integrase
MYIKAIKRKKGTIFRTIAKCKGRSRTKCFARKIDAIRWGQEAEALLHGSVPVDFRFRQLAETWFLNHCEIRKAPSSIHADRQRIEPIFKILGNFAIVDIMARDIDHLVTELKSLGSKSNKTVNRHLMLLQTIFNYGVRNEYLNKSPVRRDHFLPEDEIGYHFWRQTEAERFIAHAEQKYVGHNRFIPLLYKIALNTGMRWGEIIGLKWDCIHLGSSPQKSMITVRRTYCNVSNQLRETTKGHKIRYIGINTVLYQALKEALDRKAPDTDYVLHTSIGSPLRVANVSQRYFKRDLKEAGVMQIRFHDMRHTYASHFMMNGGSLYDLQKILGHSDLKMTMRYAHLSKEHILSKADLVVLGQKDNVISVDFAHPKTASF